MKDIHSHVLFGIDDGPQNIDDSLDMLRDAAAIGYTGIVCSSHYYPGIYENKNYDLNFKLLQEGIKENKIPIEIYKGNEAVLHPEVLKHLKDINTINGGDYILIELDPGIIYQSCLNFMKRVQGLGYKPVLAHIERYTNFTKKELINLYNAGVILQMNIREVEEMNRDIKSLLMRRYIEVVATDSHNMKRRNYKLEHYMEKLKKIVGDEYFKILTDENPSRIINNKEIIRGEWQDEKKNTCNIFVSLWRKLFTGNEPE